MAHYAKIAEDGTVLSVIVASPEFAATLSGTWERTYFFADQRKNFAGPGYKFDSERNAFIPPEPAPVPGETFTFNEDTCRWDRD